MKKRLTITGMSCQHCVNHVKEYLEEVDGVKDVVVDLEKGTAVFEADANVTEASLNATFEGTTYVITKIEDL